jgi:hypothetical protein
MKFDEVRQPFKVGLRPAIADPELEKIPSPRAMGLAWPVLKRVPGAHAITMHPAHQSVQSLA